MTRLLFFYGHLIWPALALLGLLLGSGWVWRRFARRAVLSAWRPTPPKLGDVVLDGVIDSDHRLPRGRVVDASGLTAGRLWLKLRDGERVALEGPISVLDRVPGMDDDPEIHHDLPANHPVRVRARLAPSKTATTLGGVVPSGGPYRADSRGLTLVPRADVIELASRRCPRRPLIQGALLGALVGATLGLFAPGFGLVLDAPTVGLASPLFRTRAITTLASDMEVALRDADDEWAARHVVRYLLLRRERDGVLCPDELPGAPSAFVMAELAAHCRRPQWLRTFVETNLAQLTPGRAQAWLARAAELGAPADPSFAFTEARVALTSGAPLGPTFDALRWQLPAATHCAFERADDDAWRRQCWWRAMLRGELDALAPALFAGGPWERDEARLIALALGRCGATDAQPWCDKQLRRTFDPPHLSVGDSPRAVVDRGAYFAHLHARSEGLDPHLRRALAERALAFELMVAPTAGLGERARLARRALEALPEAARPTPPAPKPGYWSGGGGPRSADSSRARSLGLLAQVAAWRGAAEAFGVLGGRLADLRGGQDGRSPLAAPRLDDSPEAFVHYALRRGEVLPPERCEETVPTSYALAALLTSRRWHHARCGATPAHDARAEALLVGYGDAERGALLAVFDEAEQAGPRGLGAEPPVQPPSRAIRRRYGPVEVTIQSPTPTSMAETFEFFRR